jgi:hypothetical protein
MDRHDCSRAKDESINRLPIVAVWGVDASWAFYLASTCPSQALKIPGEVQEQQHDNSGFVTAYKLDGQEAAREALSPVRQRQGETSVRQVIEAEEDDGRPVLRQPINLQQGAMLGFFSLALLGFCLP